MAAATILLMPDTFSPVDIFCPFSICFLFLSMVHYSITSTPQTKDIPMTTQNAQITTADIFACYDMVRGVLLSKCRNPQTAHDAAMNGILKAIDNMDKYNGKSKVSTWVCTVAYRLWLDSIRSHANSRTSYTGDSVFLENMGGTYDMNEMHVLDVNDLVAQALETLSPAHREVITLHYIDGLKYREIAQRINKPIGTVMSRLNQAKGKLKAYNNGALASILG